MSNQKGFALPTVIMTSLALFIIGFAILQTVMSLRESGLSNYYTKIAEEAAEAGLTYASACLENNQRLQTWGPTDSDGASRPTLKQNTTCDGSSASSVNSVLVADDDSIKTEFEVGNLDFSLENATQVSGVQISSKGYAKVKSGSGVSKTYEATIKKTITWASDLAAIKSASGTNKTCAIMSNNVYCWGYNTDGQLGNDSLVDSNIPVRVKKETGVLAGKTITDIFSAEGHNCVLADDEMYCWGNNYWGQLGDGSRTDRYKPVKVAGFDSLPIIGIGGTKDTSCAIVSSGKVYCWGANQDGTVGVNQSSPWANPDPQLVATGSGDYLPSSYSATKLTASGSRSANMCMIASGDAYCWGPDDVGQIGDGGSINSNDIMRQPKKVNGLLSGKTVTDISADGWYPNGSTPKTHVCAVADSRAYCWGDNRNGQLGDGYSAQLVSSPSAVSTPSGNPMMGKDVDIVAAGLAHTCALAEQMVYCWGRNSVGQVGDDTSTDRIRPVEVVQETGKIEAGNVTTVTAGANRGCAINTQGKSYCWGLNGQGQIGDGTLTNRRVPTESLFLRPDNNEYIY